MTDDPQPPAARQPQPQPAPPPADPEAPRVAPPPPPADAPPADAPPADAPPADAPPTATLTRTVLKFDSGRRSFTRAILTLSVAAAGLLAFALYFFWNLL